jgi:hypothetical protein
MSENLQIIKNSIHQNLLIFTFCNFGYMLFVENFINRIQELKTPWKLLVICIDKKSFEYIKKNLKYDYCFYIDMNVTNEFVPFSNRKNFTDVTYKKLDCFQYILDAIINKSNNLTIKKIVYTDTDIFIYKDFFDDILKNYNDKLIYFQNDNGNKNNNNNENLCSGFIIFNNKGHDNLKSVKVFKYKEFKFDISKSTCGEQTFLNAIKQHYSHDTLPRNIYPNGVFFNQNCICPDAKLLHYNWMVGHDKIKNMIYNCHIRIDNIHVKTPMIYPPFSKSSTMEEYFYKYIRNKIINSKFKYLSIFWTNVLNHNVNCMDTINNYKLIQPNLYTITQHDDGFRNYAQTIEPNMLFFSAGKFFKHKNNIDVPLIYDDDNYLENIRKARKNEEIKYLCSFIGAQTHQIRKNLFNSYKDDSSMYFSVKNWTPAVPKDSQDEFINITLKSKFGLAPRGYGCTSFRLYEILKLGKVPVYICNDEFKLPYKEIFDFSEICVLCHEKEISSLKEKLLSISDEQYKKMLENYQKHKHLFTMDGMCEYILNKVN